MRARAARWAAVTGIATADNTGLLLAETTIEEAASAADIEAYDKYASEVKSA